MMIAAKTRCLYGLSAQARLCAPSSEVGTAHATASMAWCTIESDPGVFTEMVSSLGVENVAVEEIFSLDVADQARETSYGLVFLFKYVAEADGRMWIDPSDMPDLFFARQVVQNACATQAILSVLLNCDDIDVGPQLGEFKAFTIALDSESRGYAIGDSDIIRNVHNSFARADPFSIEESKHAHGEKEDAYHFVAYIPFQGKVYELDGLKPGPILLGEYLGDWLDVAKPAVQARMNRYSAAETSFNLLSIRPKLSSLLEAELEELQARLESLALSGVPESSPDMESLKMEILTTRGRLDDELAKQERDRQENVRRRHNYIPFVMCLLKHLAKKGKLQGLVDAAKAKKLAVRAPTK